MIEYIFYGRVVAINATISFRSADPPLTGPMTYMGSPMTWALYFDTSDDFQLQVTTEVQVEDLSTFRNDMTDLARRIFNLGPLLYGIACDVGIWSVLELPAKRLVRFADALELPSLALPGMELERLQVLLFGDTSLYRCLEDFKLMILRPKDSAFFAYRVAETIMLTFTEGDTSGDRAQGWEKMREALQIDRSILEYMASVSKPIRHGSNVNLTADARKSIADLALRLIWRYIHFIDHDRTALPDNDYPVLILEDAAQNTSPFSGT